MSTYTFTHNEFLMLRDGYDIGAPDPMDVKDGLEASMTSLSIKLKEANSEASEVVMELNDHEAFILLGSFSVTFDDEPDTIGEDMWNSINSKLNPKE